MAGSSLGTTTLAANAVILEIIFILVYFIDGMANGVSVFSGKAFGTKNRQLLEETMYIGLRCLAIFVAAASIIMFWCRTYFISVMTNLPEVSAYADSYSIFLVIHPLCACVGLLLYGMYTGVGHTSAVRNMMFIAVVFFYICQNIMIDYFANYGIWATYSLTYLLESVILALSLPQLRRKFI